MPGAPADDIAALPAWDVGAREDFLDAIARHRRASWQVTAVCALCLAILLLVVATLMAPLLYGLIVLALDLVNLLTPTPNLLRAIMAALDGMTNGERPPPAAIVRLWGLAALPGLIWMSLIVLALRRIVRNSATFNAAELSALGHAPRPDKSAEQRFANVVRELAVAAMLPVPAVVICASPARSAAIFGRDEGHATIMVSEGALAALDRDDMMGVAGHLIGAVANGDLVIGTRVVIVQSLLGLFGRLPTAMAESGAWKPLLLLPQCLLAPDGRSARALTASLADPMADPMTPPERGESGKLTLRQWLTLPFIGPLAMTGFLTAIVSLFLLAPIMALAWRRRKYMADATAVRLTRAPDMLAHGIGDMAGGGGDTPVASSFSHLAIVGGGAARAGMLAGSFVPMFPAAELRQHALAKLGATYRPAARPHWWSRPGAPLAMLLLALIVILVPVLIVMLVMVSAMLSCVFTLLPVAMLDGLLRWAAG